MARKTTSWPETAIDAGHEWITRRPPPVAPAKRTTGPLTRRGVQVLELLAAGHDTEGIAAALGVSFNTARTHRFRAYADLAAHNSVTAVLEAIRRGLISVPGVQATPPAGER